MLSSEVRAAAYSERHVANSEAEGLEDALAGVEYSVLFPPHGFPVKAAFSNVREFMPEVNYVVPCTQEN